MHMMDRSTGGDALSNSLEAHQGIFPFQLEGCGMVGEQGVGMARCVWLIECVGVHWCRVVSYGCSLRVWYVKWCAMVHAVDCSLHFSGGGMAECAVADWVGTPTAVEWAGMGTWAVVLEHLPLVKVEADLFCVNERGASWAILCLFGWPVGV